MTRNIRLGEVGEPRREIIVEPEPASEPIPEPSPVTEPEQVPA